MIDRLFTPRKGEPGPLVRVLVERIGDSGGGWYRPPFRTQDPAVDPQEPYGGESSNTGYDHGWANCTMSAGAMALAFHTLGGTDKWGGLLRHHQSDLSGGTDLYDLRDAWEAYGQMFDIRSGAGWAQLESDRASGRALVLQGEGGTPGAGTYTGGHAIAVLPETHSDGRWLIGNPECDGFEWVSASALRDWAENWSSSIAWGRSAAHPPGGDDMAGVALDMVSAFSGTAVVQGDGHSYIRISDGLVHPVDAGWTKEVFAKAKLSVDFFTPSGARIPKGTPVVVIGVGQAVLIEEEVTLTGTIVSDDDIAEAVEARDAEWVAHLTPD